MLCIPAAQWATRWHMARGWGGGGFPCGMLCLLQGKNLFVSTPSKALCMSTKCVCVGCFTCVCVCYLCLGPVCHVLSRVLPLSSINAPAHSLLTLFNTLDPKPCLRLPPP